MPILSVGPNASPMSPCRFVHIVILAIAALFSAANAPTIFAAQTASSGQPQLVIIDTDIGDDIDDAFAVGLALASPELQILGFTTAWGNTPLRARLMERFLE